MKRLVLGLTLVVLVTAHAYAQDEERPPARGGVVVGITSQWSSPQRLNWFLDARDSDYDVSGNEFRLGFTRGRPLGRQWSLSYVRKRVQEGSTIVRPTFTDDPTITLRARDDVVVHGFEFDYFAPTTRIGNRVQIGALLGVGIAGPFLGTLDRHATGTVFRPNEAASGFLFGDGRPIEVPPGVSEVRDTVDAGQLFFGGAVPLVKATLAVDTVVAPGLVIRASGGLNFPGFELFSVDLVYYPGGESELPAVLREETSREELDTPAETSALWGISAGFTPHWWSPVGFRDLYVAQPTGLDVSGSDFRVGFVRGSPLRRQWGLSVVRKTIREGSTLVQVPFRDELAPSLSLTAGGDVGFVGTEAHLLVPFASVGSRVRMGALLGIGVGQKFRGSLTRHISGPIHRDESFFSELVDEGPGFFVGFGETIEVPAGATSVTDEVGADYLGLSDPLSLLLTSKLAVDVQIAPGATLRLSGGLNFPGVEILGIDLVYFFGSGAAN